MGERLKLSRRNKFRLAQIIICIVHPKFIGIIQEQSSCKVREVYLSPSLLLQRFGHLSKRARKKLRQLLVVVLNYAKENLKSKN